MPVPEAVRERDLFRYFQPWLDTQSLANIRPTDGATAWPLTYSGYRPKPSSDKALAAFCQIACLRLDVRRAMISLIDSHQQYILAEATKTLSLKSSEPQRPEDRVWLGNTVISRADGVDGETFSSTYTVQRLDGTDYSTEALVVTDMRTDERFKRRHYVQNANVLMYAGVPIKTRSGHKIGVYGVSDDKIRPQGLSAEEIDFLEDLAATVMEHLEMAKDKYDRSQGEQMVRGLAEFIEGSCSDPQTLTMEPAQRRDSQSSRTHDRQSENARLEDTPADRPHYPRRTSARQKSVASIHSVASPTHPLSPKQPELDDISQLFPRAAQIIRRSTQADGIVFFGSATGNLRAPLPVQISSAAKERRNSEDSQSSSSDQLSGGSASLKRARAHSNTSTDFSKRTGETGASDERKLKTCEVLALSIDEAHVAEADLVPGDFAFSESSMERYVRKYPYGKFFAFTDKGSGISSGDEQHDCKHQDALLAKADAELEITVPKSALKRTKKKNAFIPTELLKVLPGIRSLIFLPLWEYTEEKFVAGAFIWTSTAGRLMSPSNELPYLKAFGNSIMSEIARMNAQKADRAKATFIASVSHELRSPLHGILGGVEFLMETELSEHQRSLLFSVETCSKTLLDTIDHVLDYAKINKLRNASQFKNRKDANSKRSSQLDDSSIMGLNADFDLAGLIEEATDAVCAGHTSKRKHSATTGSAVPPDTDVAILLSIDPRTKKPVRSQPGAIRRIVMNILGNALKYTSMGYVSVTLALEEKQSPSKISFKLSFVDSGKGMSQEYQRTKLFSPFSQEDPFAVGTGLGLSIVRQIVEQLGGTISVNSTQGVGTEVDVILHLPLSGKQAEVITQSVNAGFIDTRGKRLCMLTPPHSDDKSIERYTRRLADSLADTCKVYFGFEVELSSTTKGIDADIFLIPEPPPSEKLFSHHGDSIGKGRDGRNVPIVVCCPSMSRAVELRRNEGLKMIKMGRRLEVIAQPCGPQKLSHVFQRCLNDANESPQRGYSPPQIFSTPALNESEVITAGKHELAINDRVSPLSTPIIDSGSQFQLLGDMLTTHRPAARSAEDANKRNDLITKENQVPGTSEVEPFNKHASSTPVQQPSETQAHEKKRDPHILLVDDNPINLQLLVTFMRKHSLPFAQARNGLEALNAYKNAASSNPPSPFDFVLMDVSMPVMDGLEATRWIRKYEEEKNLKPTYVIALTGLATQQAQQEALGSGVDRYLPKPVKFGDLKAILER